MDNFAGIGLLIFMLVSFVISIGLLIFWIATLIDCAKNEPAEGNDRIIWIVVIAVLGWLGAVLYVLIQKPKRQHCQQKYGGGYGKPGYNPYGEAVYPPRK